MSKFVCSAGTMTFVDSSIASLCLTSATIDVSCDVVSMTCMGDELWVSTAAGSKSWTCSFETAFDDEIGIDISNTIGVSATLTFETTDGLAYSGTAIITSISANVPVDGYGTVSWTATGSGSLGEE